MPAFTRMGVAAEVQGFKAFSNNLNTMQKDIAKTGKSTEQMAKQGQNAGKLISKAFATIGIAIGAAAIAQKMIQIGRTAIDTAIQIEQLGVATENLAKQIGTSGDAMVSAIQRASAGTVDRMAAMQAANKAMLFGIVESKEEMAELTQIAVTLGSAMGQTAAKSLDDLTTALGRNSPMILDNLGITLKLEEAHRTYAAAIGKTVEQLTEEEKAMAFRKAALIEGRKRMDELGGITETAALRQERLNRAWTEFITGVGKFTLAGDDALSIAEELTHTFDIMADALDRVYGRMLDIQALKLQGEAMLEVQIAAAKATGSYGELAKAIVTSELPYKVLNRVLLENVGSYEEFDRIIRAVIKEEALLGASLALSRTQWIKLRQAEIDAKHGAQGVAGAIAEMNREMGFSIIGIEELTAATRRQETGLMDINAVYGDFTTIAESAAESLKIEEQASKDAKTATDELTRAIEAQMQVYRDIQIEQTNYILGLKQSTLDAEAAEATYYQNRAGIAEQSNEAVKTADETLKTELTAAEEDWNEIRTQLLGDWDAKGQEQIEKDLAWHKAIFENRVGEAHVAHAAELKEIEAASTEQTEALAAGYAQQQADQKAADEEALFMSALRTMKEKGEFEKYEQLAGKSAEEAAAGFEAGTIKMTDAIQTDVAGAMQGLETTAAGVGDVVESNEEKMTTLFDNTARTALLAGGKMSDVLLGIGTGTTTMAGKATTAFTDTQTEWDKLITGMQTTVTEVKWEELGVGSGKDMIDGIIKGVKERVEALEQVMFETGEAALAAYKKAIEGASPAKAFIPLGISMVQGIIVGIEEAEHDLTEAGRDALEDAFKVWRKSLDLGASDLKHRLKSQIAKALDDLTVGAGETMAEAAERVWRQLVATAVEHAPSLAGALEDSFDVVLEALGMNAEQTFFTIAERMSELLGAARVFGGLGGTAAQLLRAREIRPGEERIRAMEDELALLEEQGTELQRQADLVAEIAVERAKVEEHERAILEFEEQQQNLRFLEQQIKLLDLIDKYQLDAQQILGGVQLGVGADLTAIMEAMTAALQEVIQVTQAETFGAAGLGYAAIAPAQVNAPATTTTTVNQNFGDTNIAGSMGQAQFAAWIRQIVTDAIGA